MTKISSVEITVKLQVSNIFGEVQVCNISGDNFKLEGPILPILAAMFTSIRKVALNSIKLHFKRRFDSFVDSFC